MLNDVFYVKFALSQLDDFLRCQSVVDGVMDIDDTCCYLASLVDRDASYFYELYPFSTNYESNGEKTLCLWIFTDGKCEEYSQVVAAILRYVFMVKASLYVEYQQLPKDCIMDTVFGLLSPYRNGNLPAPISYGGTVFDQRAKWGQD